jgi:hypothetical protein
MRCQGCGCVAGRAACTSGLRNGRPMRPRANIGALRRRDAHLAKIERRKEREVTTMTNLERIRKELSPAVARRWRPARPSSSLGNGTAGTPARAPAHSDCVWPKPSGSARTASPNSKRGELLLSTLRKTVEAMGGSLSLVAEFPGGGATEGATEAPTRAASSRALAPLPAAGNRPGKGDARATHTAR